MRFPLQANETVDVYSVNDAVVQEVHFGAKSETQPDPAAFTSEDFCDLINPNIVQSAPQVRFFLFFEQGF